MLLALFAFIAGALTALAPCALPVLPIIISGAISGEKTQKSRPYIIVGSLAISLAVFTVVLKATTLLVMVPQAFWTTLSGIIIILLGLIQVWPEIWDNFVVKMGWQAGAQRLLAKGGKRGGTLGLILTGAALGPVFASCSPTYAFILATVLPRNFGGGLAYLAIYILGLVSLLLLVAIFGQKFISRFNWAADAHSIFRRALGVLFIIIGLSIVTGYDKRVEMWVADHTPFDVTKIDQVLIQSSHKTNISPTPPSAQSDLFNVPPTPAPEFAGLQSWINSQPLKMADLRGKVVLIDFWAYSCINCIRTLPYLEKWYETYKDKEFVIIGVQTPEFSFERLPENVQNAAKQYGLTYPIALDNNYATWGAFDNQFWPADYLIDKKGQVRTFHAGEGDYDKTERAIQALLGISQPLTTSKSTTSTADNITPETYLGSDRANAYAGSPDLKNGLINFAMPPSLGRDNWALGGQWQINGDRITAKQTDATLRIHVRAKKVFIVAGTEGGQPKQVKISSNSAQQNWFGADAPNGLLTINGAKLYNIASFNSITDTTIELKAQPGTVFYTFTFGAE